MIKGGRERERKGGREGGRKRERDLYLYSILITHPHTATEDLSLTPIPVHTAVIPRVQCEVVVHREVAHVLVGELVIVGHGHADPAHKILSDARERITSQFVPIKVDIE